MTTPSRRHRVPSANDPSDSVLMADIAPTTDLLLTGLVRRYRTFALGPVSTTVPRGVTALLGANGAGKTTLMRLIVGTARPTSGQVRLPKGGTGGAPVGFLPQDFVGPPRATAQDYLTYVAWCRSTRRFKITAKHVADALEAVGLTDRADSRIGSLSGGMVRRLGVAQALLGDSPMLVLDEPTVGLDPIQRHDLRDLVGQLGKHTVVLMSTHLAEDVAAVADHVLVLDEGALLYDGSVGGLCDGQAVTSEALEAGFLTLVRGERRSDNAA